jgi:predicted AAA+ superfamily ATPase
MKKQRYLKSSISEVLPKKMAFIGGPRQVGKTWLSLEFLKPKSVKSKGYFNWDFSSDKSIIMKEELPLESPVLVLDEIHKYKHWRRLIKGIFDKFSDDHKIIVTGSARLDYFRKGGDSLLGRYRYFRLHPFSLTELSSNPSSSDLQLLLKFGGFPEPLFRQSEVDLRIWQRDRMQRVVSEDLRDLESIKEISLLLLLAEILPERVGSLLSVQNLSEDLDVSQPTVQRWLGHLSNLYYCYLISPYGAPKIRAVKKLQKLYLWDWSIIKEIGPRFENLVASHLLKYCHFVSDTQGYNMELRYLRDKDSREIDFVVLKDKKPIFAVECKTGEKHLSKHISYFKERTTIPEFYQVHQGKRDFGNPKTGRVLPLTTFCKELDHRFQY